LNEAQRSAATFDGGPLRIIAGPGTGKTTTLTARVVNLLDQGVAPERILLLTFTRRAAQEMLSRVRLAAPGTGGARVAGGTFHSTAHVLLRRHHELLGLAEGFGVLDAADAADLLDSVKVAQHRSSSVRRFPKKATLAALYSKVVNTGQPLSAVLGHDAPWCSDQAEEIADLFHAYGTRKRELAVLDFDDLLLYWRAATEDEALGAELGSCYDHVLVDEFQDVNRLQLDIVAGLRRRDPRVTIVGDDAQAIYAFRGASPRHLLDAERHFPGLSTITLEQNYRSTAAILAVANALAADAPEGFTARLVEHHPHPGAPQPRLTRCDDEATQTDELLRRVLEAYDEGCRLQDQAVLVRAAHHSAAHPLREVRRPPLSRGGPCEGPPRRLPAGGQPPR